MLVAMPKHARRLIFLLIGFAFVAVAARNFLVDKSFYEYGHYRGNAVAEIARDKPKFQGTQYCKSCHAAQFAQWSKGVHESANIGKVVKCEVCHGPGGGRDPVKNYINATTGPIHPKNLKLVVPNDTRALCTLCHEKMPGRPVQQAQIVIQDHAGTLQCTVCHNPHSPRTFVGALIAPARPGNAAAGKSKTEACAGCHGNAGVSLGLPGPTLAGQSEAYLVEALTAYKTGKRNNELMKAMVASMGDGDIANVAAYYAGLKCDVGPKTSDQAAYARKAGASVCTNCHGADGVSPDHTAPNLAGQSKDYLASALKSYGSGARSHVVMYVLANATSDADVEKIATYYARATCQ
jgi:cytochrome c553